MMLHSVEKNIFSEIFVFYFTFPISDKPIQEFLLPCRFKDHLLTKTPKQP